MPWRCRARRYGECHALCVQAEEVWRVARCRLMSCYARAPAKSAMAQPDMKAHLSARRAVKPRYAGGRYDDATVRHRFHYAVTRADAMSAKPR